MKRQDITPAELARRAKKDPGMISRLLAGERSATPETLRDIAIAINQPLEVVFRVAVGMPVQKQELSPKKRELLARLENADDETVQVTIDLLEVTLKMQQRQVPGGAGMQKAKG